MSKQGEIEITAKSFAEDPAFIEQAYRKPWCFDDCGGYLAEMGALLTLIPPPPARLLDVGVGNGYTSHMFALRGYTVLGTDIAPDCIKVAEECTDRWQSTNVKFIVHDFESSLREHGMFDVAVFKDSLHHATDQPAALRMVFEALRPGGICAISEPGLGHSWRPSTRAYAKKWDVTERDTPPYKVYRMGREIGFRLVGVWPHIDTLLRFSFPRNRNLPGLAAILLKWLHGIIVLKRPDTQV